MNSSMSPEIPYDEPSETEALADLLYWVTSDADEDFTPEEEFGSEPAFSLDFQWDIEPF